MTIKLRRRWDRIGIPWELTLEGVPQLVDTYDEVVALVMKALLP